MSGQYKLRVYSQIVKYMDMYMYVHVCTCTKMYMCVCAYVGIRWRALVTKTKIQYLRLHTKQIYKYCQTSRGKENNRLTSVCDWFSIQNTLYITGDIKIDSTSETVLVCNKKMENWCRTNKLNKNIAAQINAVTPVRTACV